MKPTIEVLSTTLNHLGKRRSNFYLSLSSANDEAEREQYKSEIARLDRAIEFHEAQRREVADTDGEEAS